jgi:multidrug efflux pump subunit AcrA (membrane-fusion protein)
MTYTSLRLLLLTVVLCLAVQVQSAQAQGANVPAATPVTVIRARIGQLEATRETTAVIGPEQETVVSSGASGRVLTIFKRRDMPVQAGEVVMQLDTEQLELLAQDAALALSSAQVSLNSALAANEGQITQAELAVRSADAAYRTAQQQYLEGQDLFEIGALSEVELSTLETAFLTAETNLSQVQATLAQLTDAGGSGLELLRLQVEQAQNRVTQAEQALTEASITSPLTGEITELLVEQGGFVIEGNPVFSVATTEQQLVTFSVPLEVADRLTTQGQIRLPYGGRSYTAEVISASALDPETQLVEVTASLRPTQVPIPNGSVTQLSYRYAAAGGIILPSEAVQLEPGRRFVFIVQDGRAVRRNIELVGEVEGQVAAIGVEEGARVIYPVPLGLRERERVTPVDR